MKFKVGDRVRVTNKMRIGYTWFIGKVGTIIAIDSGEPYVDFGSINSRQWFSESELEYE